MQCTQHHAFVRVPLCSAFMESHGLLFFPWKCKRERLPRDGNHANDINTPAIKRTTFLRKASGSAFSSTVLPCSEFVLSLCMSCQYAPESGLAIHGIRWTKNKYRTSPRKRIRDFTLESFLASGFLSSFAINGTGLPTTSDVWGGVSSSDSALTESKTGRVPSGWRGSCVQRHTKQGHRE